MVMIINIGPAAATASETLNALRFATRVREVELGKAKRTVSKIKAPPAT